MSAFETYARCYDLLYSDKDYAAEARFVDGLLRSAAPSAKAMLEIGCGTGMHAREFARLGWQVTGVDLSSAMIAIARQRSDAMPGVEFREGAAAEFSAGRVFPAAASLFHVVSYQAGEDEAFRMFANVRQHLEPGGVFVFDFWHGPGVMADPPAVRVRRAEDERTRLIRIAEPDHRPEVCRIDVAYEVIIEDRASGRIERVHELHRMRYFFLPELTFLLDRAGFMVERTMAGLEERPLDGAAWYGLIVARAK